MPGYTVVSTAMLSASSLASQYDQAWLWQLLLQGGCEDDKMQI